MSRWFHRRRNTGHPGDCLPQKAILGSYKNSNRYPDDYLPLLKKKIAEHWNVGAENILLGAGSSDIIGQACYHASRTKGHIVTAEPSYRVWNGQASSFGLSFNRIPLTDEKKIDPGKMVSAITNETMDINFIRMFIEGPEVSLNGSPTVSPVTDALCGSDFL